MEYFAFQWHITEACDQRCRHCYIYALGSHAKFKETALEDMVTVIENCKAFCEKAGRLPYLYITGGDPMWRGSIRSRNPERTDGSGSWNKRRITHGCTDLSEETGLGGGTVLCHGGRGGRSPGALHQRHPL